jgi:drug/metabolite transporter (DMT)-like permease
MKTINKVMEKERLADLSLIFVSLIWGSSFVIIKDTLIYLNEYFLLVVRFAIATGILGLYLLLKKINPFKRDLLKKGAILGLMLFIGLGTQTVGLKYTTTTNSAFITGLYIVLIPIFSVLLFKKYPKLWNIFAVVLATLGLFLLTFNNSLGFHFNFGDLITIIGAVAFAFQILYTDKYVKKSDPFCLTFTEFVFMTLFSSIFVILFGNISTNFDTHVMFSLIYLGVVVSFVALIIQTTAQKFTQPLKVALIFTLEPVFAGIFGFIFASEILASINLFGAVLILLGMIIAEIKK